MQRCWNQEPLSRPKISEVFQALPSSDLDKLQRLYVPGVASHEFQRALSRFYGCAEYQDHIDGLRGADLKKYVDFLDMVRQPSNISYQNPCFDSV